MINITEKKETNEKLTKEVISITQKLRGYPINETFFLINDYLKATIELHDFKEDDPAFSTAYAALVCKKANCTGFINAFRLILNELNIQYSTHDAFFKHEGQKYSYSYIKGNFDGRVHRFSPYLEKLCNQWLMPYENFINYSEIVH